MVPCLLFFTQPVIPALVQRSRVSFVRFRPAGRKKQWYMFYIVSSACGMGRETKPRTVWGPKVTSYWGFIFRHPFERAMLCLIPDSYFPWNHTLYMSIDLEIQRHQQSDIRNAHFDRFRFGYVNLAANWSLFQNFLILSLYSHLKKHCNLVYILRRLESPIKHIYFLKIILLEAIFSAAIASLIFNKPSQI